MLLAPRHSPLTVDAKPSYTVIKLFDNTPPIQDELSRRISPQLGGHTYIHPQNGGVFEKISARFSRGHTTLGVACAPPSLLSSKSQLQKNNRPITGCVRPTLIDLQPPAYLGEPAVHHQETDTTQPLPSGRLASTTKAYRGR